MPSQTIQLNLTALQRLNQRAKDVLARIKDAKSRQQSQFESAKDADFRQRQRLKAQGVLKGKTERSRRVEANRMRKARLSELRSKRVSGEDTGIVKTAEFVRRFTPEFVQSLLSARISKEIVNKVLRIVTGFLQSENLDLVFERWTKDQIFNSAVYHLYDEFARRDRAVAESDAARERADHDLAARLGDDPRARARASQALSKARERQLADDRRRARGSGKFH